jgi:hypothetical protein
LEIEGVKECIAVIEQADFESFYHRKPVSESGSGFYESESAKLLGTG